MNRSKIPRTAARFHRSAWNGRKKHSKSHLQFHGSKKATMLVIEALLQRRATYTHKREYCYSLSSFPGICRSKKETLVMQNLWTEMVLRKATSSSVGSFLSCTHTHHPRVNSHTWKQPEQTSSRRTGQASFCVTAAQRSMPRLAKCAWKRTRVPPSV